MDNGSAPCVSETRTKVYVLVHAMNIIFSILVLYIVNTNFVSTVVDYFLSLLPFVLLLLFLLLFISTKALHSAKF